VQSDVARDVEEGEVLRRKKERPTRSALALGTAFAASKDVFTLPRFDRPIVGARQPRSSSCLHLRFAATEMTAIRVHVHV
jgi:hypothetical protein